ncbi:MAG: TonB-dependent receptor, partial [Flavobacteriales bacterium]|nr:TonB-dependent receptor [Flavobacteriales bacterium]
GTSISNTFQTELSLSFWKQLEFKTGYSFLDVYREIEGQKTLLPFNPRNKVVASFGYKPASNKYRLNMNVHWYGKQRLPNTASNPIEFQRSGFSTNYTILNAQFTYNIRDFELYLGCENIFDFRQVRPINSWQNPFGKYFDTSLVWGPTRGREIYVGFRLRINQKKNNQNASG